MLVFGSIVNTPPAISTLLPLVGIVLDLVIAIYFIRDLYQPERRVNGGDKTVWLLIILFGSVIGWLAYLLVGREN